MDWLNGNKTFLTALITGLIGTYMGVDSALNDQLPNIPQWALMLLGSFGLYSMRDAIRKVEGK